MKITFLLGAFPWKPSGGALVVYQYANGLAERGHDVEIIHARRLPGWTRSQKAPIGRRIRGLLRSPLEFLISPRPRWIRLDQRVKTRMMDSYRERDLPDADAVVATFWPTAEFVRSLSKCKGEPYYLIQHLETWAGDAKQVEETWLAPLTKIFVADWLREQALSLGICAEETLHVPNAVDHRRFFMSREIKGRPKRVAMVYSEIEWKGSRDGLAALEMAKQEHPDMEAVLYGIWRRPADLPSWIKYHRSPGETKMRDEILNQASIFLCPSWSEGWGLPGAEAMACGCALLSTDNGGVRDYAEGGEAAILAPSRDAAELGSALKRLLSSEDLRVRVATRGQRRICEFTWKRSVAKLEAELIRRHRKGLGAVRTAG